MLEGVGCGILGKKTCRCCLAERPGQSGASPGSGVVLRMPRAAVGGRSLALIRTFAIPMRLFISTLASLLHI